MSVGGGGGGGGGSGGGSGGGGGGGGCGGGGGSGGAVGATTALTWMVESTAVALAWNVVAMMTLSVTPRDASLASQYSASPAVFSLMCRSRHDLPLVPLLSQTQDVTSRSAAVARPSAPWHGTRSRKAASNAHEESCVLHVLHTLQKKQGCCLLGSGSCFGFFAGEFAALIRPRSARTPIGARWAAAAHGGLRTARRQPTSCLQTDRCLQTELFSARGVEKRTSQLSQTTRRSNVPISITEITGLKSL